MSCFIALAMFMFTQVRLCIMQTHFPLSSTDSLCEFRAYIISKKNNNHFSFGKLYLFTVYKEKIWTEDFSMRMPYYVWIKQGALLQENIHSIPHSKFHVHYMHSPCLKKYTYEFVVIFAFSLLQIQTKQLKRYRQLKQKQMYTFKRKS